MSFAEGVVISRTVLVEGGGALPQHISPKTTPADETPQQSPFVPARVQGELSGGWRPNVICYSVFPSCLSAFVVNTF
jgi:hypothetical protein